MYFHLKDQPVHVVYRTTAVYCQKYMEYIRVLRGQNAELLIPRILTTSPKRLNLHRTMELFKNLKDGNIRYKCFPHNTRHCLNY